MDFGAKYKGVWGLLQIVFFVPAPLPMAVSFHIDQLGRQIIIMIDVCAAQPRKSIVALAAGAQ
jgi:hypothetical protein